MDVKNIKGRPKFNSDQFLGYILWKQSDGFHLRWTTKGKKAYNFRGKISCQDKMKVIGRILNENLTIKENIIEWNIMSREGIDGFDFLTPGDFTLELRIGKKKVKQKNIFLGPQMAQPKNNPFTINQVIVKKRLEKKVQKVKPVYKPEPEYESISLQESNYEAEEKSTYEPKPKTVIEPEPEPEYESIPLPEPSYEAKSEPTYEREPETIIEPEPETVIEPEPETVIEPEPEYESIRPPEPIYEHELETAIETEPEYESISPPEPSYEHEPETAIETEPEYESTPLLEPSYEAERKLTYETEPKTAIEAEPEPEYESITTLEQHYEAEPELKYESEDEPEKRINTWLKQLQTYRKESSSEDDNNTK